MSIYRDQNTNSFTTDTGAPINFADNQAIGIPVGTTGNRPGTLAVGLMRWNTTTQEVEIYNGTTWIDVSGGGTGVDFIIHDAGNAVSVAPTAPGSDAMALGDGADALEDTTIAIGQNSEAGQTGGGSTEINAIALGTSAVAYQTSGISIGLNSISGVDSASADPFAVAIGANSDATGESSIAIGGAAIGAQATVDDAIAIGEADATAQEAIAIGLNAAASATRSVSFQNSTADVYGQFAYASGNFTANGDAQWANYIARRITTDGTADQTVFLDNSSVRLIIPSDATFAFHILVVARRTDVGGGAGAWRFEGIIDNDSGTTAFIGSPIKIEMGETDAVWDAKVTANDTADSLDVDVTGEAAKTIRWVVRFNTVEVSN